MALKVSSKRFVLSDETKNLYGFITVTLGIDLSAFTDNPVMLYNHDYDRLIGQWVDYRVEGAQLTAAPAFDENDPYAMQQHQKVEDGILKGASIGISPLQFDELSGKMVKSLLLEASLTPIPNNRNALAIYSAKGQKLNASEIKQYLLSVERTDTPINNNQKMNEKLIMALVALCVQAGQTITLSAASKDDDIEGVIKKVGEHITTLTKDKTNLTADLKKLKDDAATAAEKELDTLLAEAVTQKRLSADDVAGWKEFGKVNLSAMKKNLESLKPVELVVVPGAADAAKTDLTAGDKATWDYDKYALSASAELAEMETKDPTRFNKLVQAKLAAVRGTHVITA